MPNNFYLLKPLAPLLHWGHSLVQQKLAFSPILGGGEHSVVLPKATYSPWISDKEFRSAYDSLSRATLVDAYRCYELWQLVAESAKAGSGDLLEVGVWRGGTGALIAMRSPSDTVFLCDTFTGVAKATDADPVYRGGEHSDTSMAAVEKLMLDLGLRNVRILQGIFPEQNAEQCDGRKFRFCHIDVDVYASAKGVLDWIWPRLIVGGIVVFDDFGFHDCGGVTRLVNEQRGRDDLFLFVNLNGHAVMIKRSGSQPAGE